MMRINLLKGGVPLFRAAMLVLVTSLALSGCLGGCLQPPPLKITINLLNNATIPGLPLAGTPIAETFDLPRICNLPSLSVVEEFARGAAGGLFSDWVKIDKVEVSRMTFTAKSGNFDSFNSISMAFIANETPYPLGHATNIDGLGTGFELLPETPVDLLNIFFVEGSNGCINTQIALMGVVPGDPIVFDLETELTITVRIL